jgi:hypothetical protein
MNPMAAELALPAENGVPHFGARISVLAVGFALVVSAFADDTPASAGPAGGTAPTPPPKGSYHLFKPARRTLLREMATDRPDKTESPFIVGKLGEYAEFFSQVSTEAGSGWVGTVDLGLTYALASNLHLDAGINFGVTRSADDTNPFVGLSFRY